MDSHPTPGPSSHSRYSPRPNYNGQDDSAFLLQGGYFSADIQNSGWEEFQNIGESSSHAYPQPILNVSGSECSSIPHPIPSIPNHQSRLYNSTLLSSQGLSLTIPTSPFPTDPSQPGTPYSASTQYDYPAGRICVDRQMEQEGLGNHDFLSTQDIYGVSMPSALPESSSTMIDSTSTSLSAESYTQPEWQDDYDELTSFPCGRVESTTENLVAMQGQIATTQEASLTRERIIQRKKGKDKARNRDDWSNDTQEATLARERKIQRKKDLDKARKRNERSQNKQAYTRICQLLNIDLDPINTLADRILDGVESLVEQLKLNNGTQDRLKEAEAYIRFLDAKVDKFPTGADTGPFLPNIYHKTPADSNTFATLR